MRSRRRSLSGCDRASLTTFSAEGPWRSEAIDSAIGPRRSNDYSAGRRRRCEQVILVSASAPEAQAHELSARRVAPWARRRYLAAFEAAGLHDLLDHSTGGLPGCLSFVRLTTAWPLISLVYDRRSDRVQPLAELVDRGYEDAYRQFIDYRRRQWRRIGQPVNGVGGKRGKICLGAMNAISAWVL
jgi:hypothetical protein